jgi:hypothetical protein
MRDDQNKQKINVSNAGDRSRYVAEYAMQQLQQPEIWRQLTTDQHDERPLLATMVSALLFNIHRQFKQMTVNNDPSRNLSIKQFTN